MINQVEVIIRNQLLDKHRKLEAARVKFSDSYQLRRLLQEVDAALERLGAGSYGMCEVCHEPVEAERMIADPLARFCLYRAGVPQETTELVSITGLFIWLVVYIPYRMVRRSFGRYLNLWALSFLCVFVGYETEVLLRLLNREPPPDLFLLSLRPLYAAPALALAASPFYFLFQSLRRTIGGGRYTG